MPSAIRYDIGTNYLAYINIFEDPTRLEGYKLKEPAFYSILDELGLVDRIVTQYDDEIINILLTTKINFQQVNKRVKQLQLISKDFLDLGLK
ncbi:MAG: hypothetical protein GX043_12675 [Desulfovibrionales bacterium]|nr:hypothetical protein [Desulfovibrionales bacterium]